MALRGNLKELSLPDIFQLVTFSGKTGVLRIQRGDGAQGSVWFRDGDVFFAQSNWHTDPLGERLVRAQRITPMALDRALELRAEEPEGGKRLGQILVEQGYITDKVLEAFVQEQMQDTIFDLMRWDEGDFEFEAMPEAPEEDIGLAVSIENVIMEGSRRLEEWNRIKKKIPSTDVVFKMATAPGEGTFEISLKPMEWNLLLLIDSSRSVAELAQETNRTDFEVARIVYGLFSAGLLEFATEDEIAAARIERAEREAKFARFEAERVAKLAAEKAEKAKPAPESEVSAAEAVELLHAETAAVATESTTSAPASASGALLAGPTEIPEFLGAEAQTMGADAATLEAAMGALLSAPSASPVAPAAAPAAPYTPGEEPAFIAASQESVAGVEPMPVPSVEDLLPDIADLGPTVAEAPAPSVVEEEPVAEPELVAEPEPAVEPEPVAEPEPATEVELGPGTAAVPEPQPEVAPEPQAEPAPAEFEWEPPTAHGPEAEPRMPEPTPIDAFEFLGVSAPAVEPVTETQWQPPATTMPLEPGSFVVVPGTLPAPVPEGAKPDEIQWEPPQIDFEEEPEAPVAPVPDLADLRMVPVTAPAPAADSVSTLLAGVQPTAEPLATTLPEVIRPATEPAIEAPEAAEAPAEPIVELPEAAAAAVDLTTGAEAPSELVVAAPVPEPIAPTPAASSSGIPGLQSFEHDLMSLGLGELPRELRQPTQIDEPLDLEPVVEPMGVAPVAETEPDVTPELAPQTPAAASVMPGESPTVSPDVAPDQISALDLTSAFGTTDAVMQAAPSSARPTREPLHDDAGVDFSALLQSLDISADDAEAAVPAAAQSGPEPLFETGITPPPAATPPAMATPAATVAPEPAVTQPDAAAPAAGVISTDSFLDDLAIDHDFSFSGELTDELSALTGADRPTRPTASVHKIPEEGESVLRRDSRVDRETLMKIIQGIKNL